MKRKISIIGGTLIALAITGCGSTNNFLSNNKLNGYEGDPHTSYVLDGTITGGTNAYAEASTIEQDGVSWAVTGNTTTNPWRIGGKNISNVDRRIYSTSAISGTVTSIALSFGGGSNITVHSLSVGVYSTAALAAAGSAGDVASFTPEFSLSDDVVVTKTTGNDWENCFFGITLNVSVSGKDNKFVTFKSGTFNLSQSVTPPPVGTTHTVTFNPLYGENTSMEVNDGETITDLPEGSKPNDTENQIRYPFLGWYSNVDVTDPTNPDFTNAVEFTSSTAVTSDITVYALYGETHYWIVSFNTMGGDPKDPYLLDDGYTTFLPDDITATRFGYVFAGWYTDPSCEDQYAWDYHNWQVVKNTLLYAKWTEFPITEDYRLSMLPANGFDYRIVGEVTAIVDTNKFFMQDGENVMFINDPNYSTAELHVGNTVDVYGKYHNQGSVFEFTNVYWCRVISDDTVNSQTPITDPNDSRHSNNLKYFEYKHLKLTSGFEHLSNGAYRANFSNTYGNVLYCTNTAYVNGGAFEPNDYASDDYVNVKGALYRYKDTMEYYFTSIEKAQTAEFTFVLDENNLEDSFTSIQFVGEAATRPTDPKTRKDSNYTYTFENWYLDLDDAEPYDFTTLVSGNTTLYAKWTQTVRPAKEVASVDLKSRTELSYNYTKTDGDESGSASDTLTRELTGITDTNYTDWTITDLESGIDYKGQSAGDYGSIQLRIKNSNSGVVSTANADELPLSSVTINFNSHCTNSVEIYGSNTPYTAATDLYNDNTRGALIMTIAPEQSGVAQAVEGTYKYIGIKSASGAAYLDSIQINWGGSAATYEYSDVAIRYSGFISADLWDRLNTESNIQGYGIMYGVATEIAEGGLEGMYGSNKTDSNTIDEAVAATCDGTVIKNYYTPLTATKTHPTLADSFQKGDLEGDYYIWNLKKNIASDALKTAYTAVAYIRLEDEIIFLDEVTASAKSIASQLIKDKVYEQDAFEGSLSNLASL